MCDQPSRSSRSSHHAFHVVMESNAQPKQMMVAKIKHTQQVVRWPIVRSQYDISTLYMACHLWFVFNDYKMKRVMSNIQWLLVLCYSSITTKGL
jgi:hypothetical protein